MNQKIAGLLVIVCLAHQGAQANGGLQTLEKCTVMSAAQKRQAQVAAAGVCGVAAATAAHFLGQSLARRLNLSLHAMTAVSGSAVALIAAGVTHALTQKSQPAVIAQKIKDRLKELETLSIGQKHTLDEAFTLYQSHGEALVKQTAAVLKELEIARKLSLLLSQYLEVGPLQVAIKHQTEIVLENNRLWQSCDGVALVATAHETLDALVATEFCHSLGLQRASLTNRAVYTSALQGSLRDFLRTPSALRQEQLNRLGAIDQYKAMIYHYADRLATACKTIKDQALKDKLVQLLREYEEAKRFIDYYQQQKTKLATIHELELRVKEYESHPFLSRLGTDRAVYHAYAQFAHNQYPLKSACDELGSLRHALNQAAAQLRKIVAEQELWGAVKGIETLQTRYDALTKAIDRAQYEMTNDVRFHAEHDRVRLAELEKRQVEARIADLKLHERKAALDRDEIRLNRERQRIDEDRRAEEVRRADFDRRVAAEETVRNQFAREKQEEEVKRARHDSELKARESNLLEERRQLDADKRDLERLRPELERLRRNEKTLKESVASLKSSEQAKKAEFKRQEDAVKKLSDDVQRQRETLKRERDEFDRRRKTSESETAKVSSGSQLAYVAPQMPQPSAPPADYGYSYPVPSAPPADPQPSAPPADQDPI